MARVARSELTQLALRLCTLLGCRAADLHLTSTPEGLIELRLDQWDRVHLIAQCIRVGTPEEMQTWAERAARRPRQRKAGRAKSLSSQKPQTVPAPQQSVLAASRLRQSARALRRA